MVCLEFFLQFFLENLFSLFCTSLWNGSIFKNSFLLKKNSVCIPYGYRAALKRWYIPDTHISILIIIGGHLMRKRPQGFSVSWFIWLPLELCVWQLCGPNASRATVEKSVFQTCPENFLSLNSRYTAHYTLIISGTHDHDKFHIDLAVVC